MTTPLSAEQLSHLRAHYAKDWVDTLTSEGMSTRIQQGFVRLEDAALSLTLAELVDRKALATAIAAACQDAQLQAVQACIKASMVETLGRLQNISSTSEEFLSAEAQAALRELAAHPALVKPAVMRSLVQNPALESLTRQMLQETLVEFNEKVNPFFADWGLPKLLDAVPLFGKGTLRRAFETMRRDFDKRLEPEVGKFVEGFARRALASTVDRMVERAAEPEMVALRQHAMEKILSHPLRDFTAPADEEPSPLAMKAVGFVVRDVLRHPLSHQELLAFVDEELDKQGQTTLGQWLRGRGVEHQSLSEFVPLAWPAMQRLLLADETLAELDELLRQSHARYLAKQADS